jgi:hypothetical protein
VPRGLFVDGRLRTPRASPTGLRRPKWPKTARTARRLPPRKRRCHSNPKKRSKITQAITMEKNIGKKEEVLARLLLHVGSHSIL